jgi:hypothetical protein
MLSSPSENEFAEYCSQSGVAIACLVIGRTEQLTFVKFRTADWEGYDGFSNYATTALFSEHLRPADPQSPGVMNFVRALEREATIRQQHVSGCKHQPNGQGTVLTGPIEPVVKEKPTEKLTAAHGNGVKPPPKSAPAQQLRVRTRGKDGHSLKPTRSISGLTLADFLCDR